MNKPQITKEYLDNIKKDINYDLIPYDKNKAKTSNFSTNKTQLPNNGVNRTKLATIKDAILGSGLKSGMTISFHHHFRNGDKTVKLVLEVIKELGIKDLTIASSSFTDAHNFLVDYINEGYVKALQSSGCRDTLGKFISGGGCDTPLLIRSHGGRARAIESGDLKIDVAFIAASAADEMGNANGMMGKSKCGSLGYAIVDAQYANKTIIITDNIVPYPNEIISIPQTNVDYVVEVEEIGDPKGIMSGAIRLTTNPKEELIAHNVTKIITNSQLFKNGFSIQMGTGGASLSVVKYLKKHMIEREIKASFCLGGITSHQVDLYKEGLVDVLLDTQCFDLPSVESIYENKNHIEISASMYANPHNKSPYVNKLDFVILSALEADVNFNVNVMTGSDGIIRGASGGHSDTAEGAKVSIVCMPTIRGRLSCIVDKVNTIITPGNTVDIIVTDYGIAVNPLRKDLLDELTQAGIKLVTLEKIKQFAEGIVGKAKEIEWDYSKPVAIIEARDGSILDIIYKVKD
ncbi:citrate lyase subunit alpha [Spiroplasma culicicola]|uniref:Citrate lyase alpha chain n=1 Tax=Spiroplasma culicicola AES-1 TaxID=1276246 RepID=W6A6C9_9MOLU|nr:citrate lyase subunit alpha [Spiroplasma culicicola]AHI52511.1 citrate lyase subunit alpha [Spiroplasma culicicola AES-1]